MRKICYALALAGSVALVLATSAAATMEGHEVTLTDPYAACPLTPDIFGGGNYPNTEVEPWVQRNPANPDNLIGAFQQDRWSDGGARGLVAGWSFNDGYKWGETPLPFSKCAAPFYGGAVLPYDRASDPWDDVGPDGRAYSVSISFDANDNNNAVGAATSVDGGVTWQNQQPIIADLDADPTFPFNDKESVTADPTIAGSAYVVWDRLVLVNCGVSQAAGNDIRPVAEDRRWRALARTVGPDQFARSGDIIPEPAIDPRTGQLYLVWQDGRYNANGEDDVVFSTSVQGGLTGTWTVPQRVNLPDDRAAFTPGVKVNALGQLGIDYYSLRHPDGQPDVWPVDRYLRISTGPAIVSPAKPGQTGPTASIDFNTPTHVTGPFNL